MIGGIVGGLLIVICPAVFLTCLNFTDLDIPLIFLLFLPIYTIGAEIKLRSKVPGTTQRVWQDWLKNGL